MSNSQFSSTLLTPHVLFSNLEELWSVFLLLTEPPLPVPAPHLPPTPSLPLLRTFRRSRDGTMGSGDRITTCPWYLLSPIKLRSAKAASSPRHHPALTCSRPPAGRPALRRTQPSVSSQAPTHVTSFAPSTWGPGLDEPVS